jgi:hypothetical protein
MDGYLTTPDGSLKKFNIDTKKTTTLARDLDYDPQNPNPKDPSPPRVPEKTKQGKPAYILKPESWGN